MNLDLIGALNETGYLTPSLYQQGSDPEFLKTYQDDQENIEITMTHFFNSRRMKVVSNDVGWSVDCRLCDLHGSTLFKSNRSSRLDGWSKHLSTSYYLPTIKFR